MTDERIRKAKPAIPTDATPAPGSRDTVGARAVSDSAAAASTPRPIPPLPPRAVGIGARARVAAAGMEKPAPGTVSPSGTGQDARHRGWYWHWNTLVTQYAPLLGLKGVGLLNSYTVWTDRREGSPHQGYAFPAQESEARFYGEGREELITLNKLLVALDLIEIHKEMVVRQDDRGRRWRVPHNFYKVRDPKDGLVLGLPAIVRVLELADRDRNVFRHIRHIFGPQFAPIDRTSLWHSLLPDLRALPLWQELAARAARERRTPRPVTTRATTTIANAEGDTSVSLAPTIVAHADNASSGSARGDDFASMNDTTLPATIRTRTDSDATYTSVVPLTRIAPPPYPVIAPPTDSALPPTLIARASNEPSRPMRGSIRDEGMMNVEDGRDRSVAPADRMYYQSPETREETTSTRSTSSRAYAGGDAHAGAQERGREGMRMHPPDTHESVNLDARSRGSRISPSRDPSLHEPRAAAEPAAAIPPPDPSPSRPSVSDLFAALEAQRVFAPPDARTSPESVEAWEAPADADTDADADAGDLPPDAPLPGAGVGVKLRPSAARAESGGQPLPPDPGESGEPGEGPIIVRAVAVTDQPATGTEARALLAEIESALTMANSRPPSDMEMSLYWQIAQDCDAAARGEPGPGSGLGWVRAAITEAVYSGGTNRIAPKYIARICERWTTEGYMSDGRAAPSPTAGVPAPPPQWPLGPAPRADASPILAAPGPTPDDATPTPVTVALSEADLARLWPGVVRRLEGILPTDSLRARWFTEARVIAVDGVRAVVQAADAETALKLTNYRGLISRRLSDVLGWPVEAVFQAASTRPPDPPDPSHPPDPTHPATRDDALDPTDPADPPSEESSSLPQTSTRVNPLASSEASLPTAPPPQTPSPWQWPASGSAPTLPSLTAEIAPRTTMGSGPMPLVPAMPPRTREDATPDATPKPMRVVSRAQPLPATSPPAPVSSPSVPTFFVAGTGETNRDLWPRVLARLREEMTAVTFNVWMEPTALLATDADGTFVIGARNRVQRERLERQHAADIAAALGAHLDQPVRIRLTVIGE